MDTVKPKKKSKKKLVVTLVVIVVVLAVLVGGCSMMVNSAKEKMEAAMNAMQTDVVSVRSLTKSIGATGKVISVDMEDVTTTLSGVEIVDIPVEVGDMVEAGQTVVQFDTEDIAENLAIAQRALGQTQGQYGISAENARRQLDDAVRGAEFQNENAYNNVKSAYDAYVGAIEDLEDLKDTESQAREEKNAANDVEDDVDRELKRLEEIEATGTTSDGDTYEEVCNEIYELLDKLDIYLVGGVIEPASVRTQVNAVVSQTKAAYEQAKSARESMEDAIDKYYDAYVTAISAYENTVASGESAVASAQAAQQSTALSANTDQQQKQVDALAEQLEEGSLTAPISGIVTAVNFEEGDTFLQGAILTIQDCSEFEIEAQIGEYDISDIQKGQKVLIKTDATRERELQGTVVFVAPTATVSAASSMSGMTAVSTDPTYEVRISVDTPSDRLRLDMSANLSIIIQEVQEALTVPYNAVQTAEDGTYFVEVVNGDETTTVVPVEVVMESNYYTQVAGDLQEGQTVRVISQEATDIFSEMMGMHDAAQGGF